MLEKLNKICTMLDEIYHPTSKEENGLPKERDIHIAEAYINIMRSINIQNQIELNNKNSKNN